MIESGKLVEYPITDMDINVSVFEFKRQKSILDTLDEMLENYNLYEQGILPSNPLEDESFYILYKDGSFYSLGECWEDGVYKKRNIKSIVYDNPCDTWVYGEYEVNEYGVVSAK